MYVWNKNKQTNLRQFCIFTLEKESLQYFYIYIYKWMNK